MPPAGRSAISLGTVVSVSQGATLELSSGNPQHIGALAGTGSVLLDDTDLILGSGASATFSGSISGNGNVIFDGDDGSQYLSAVNTATGDFIVRSGIASVATSGALHRWFRFTVQAVRSPPLNVTQMSEFALYTSDGTRCNLGLTLGAGAESALLPGQYWTSGYSVGGSGGEHAGNLFDNNTATKWCPNNNFVVFDDPSTWRGFTMRLADNVGEVITYNLCTANDSPERDPVTWQLESSADGIIWQTVDARTNFIPATTRFAWYNSGVPFPFQFDRAISSEGNGIATAIPSGSVVEVQAGATLAVVGGTQPISALRVDMVAEAGTITRFTPTANGTLYLTNATGSPASWVIPITFGSVDNPANLTKWQIIVDGNPLNGYRLAYDPVTGNLTLTPQGTILMIK
jgi:hypothetical protein